MEINLYEMSSNSLEVPNSQELVPETPVKVVEGRSETLRLLPEFCILVKDLDTREMVSTEAVVKNLFGPQRPALLSVNKSIDGVRSKKMSPAASKSSGKRGKSSVGHAIKRPKQSLSSSSAPISDSLKEILAKKKAFSISTNNDKEVIQIQSQVDNLLDVLDDSEPSKEENDLDFELQKINNLMAVVKEPAAGKQSEDNKNKVLEENEMDQLIDKILGSESQPPLLSSEDSFVTAVSEQPSLNEFESVISRLENAQEADLFADEVGTEAKKLFPVFIKGATNANNDPSPKSSSSSKSSIVLPLRDSGGKEQMILDAGQKKYGQVECKKCGCVYDPDDRKDVEHHLEYHNRNNVILRHKGWKNERIIATFPNGGRVIQVVEIDPQLWWKRIKEVLPTIDFELGIAGSDALEEHKNCTVFMYIQKKQIVGLLLAEEISQAYRMIDSSEILCTEETFPVECGISRLWTVAHARRTGVATKLVNLMRENFYSHKTLGLNEFAFTTPTSASGRDFAANYTGSPCFLVY